MAGPRITSASCNPQKYIWVPTYDPRPRFRKIPILYWHTIDASFEKAIKFLKYYGFSFISMDDLFNYYNGGNLPKKPCIVQFDDGADTVYTVAKPVLLEYGVRATLYICTEFIENQAAPAGDPTRTWLPMTWTQIQELVNDGLVDVQAHSHSHYQMSTRTMTQNQEDINIMMSLLNMRLTGINVRHFSYPYSNYDNNVIALIKDNNFLTGRAGGNQEDGWTNALQTGMFATFYEDRYAIKVLWSIDDLYCEQFNDRICPNDNLVPELEYTDSVGAITLGWKDILNGGTNTFPNEGTNGGVCLKMNRADGTAITHRISRSIPVEFMDRIGINCDIKTQGISDARIMAYFYKTDGTVLKTLDCVKLLTDQVAYKNFDYEFSIDSELIKYIDIRCVLYNSGGTMWVDNMRVKRRVAGWR